ncbi:hypothetical protein CRUP_016486 [Coryphaenoides rupestris]|nr:hypothetical protein CRUP_016486 [Coryphaenoides rupestris]
MPHSVGRYLVALGRSWHPEEFTCSQCKAVLDEGGFFEERGSVFCTKCYDNRYAPNCAKCKKKIAGKGGGNNNNNDNDDNKGVLSVLSWRRRRGGGVDRPLAAPGDHVPKPTVNRSLDKKSMRSEMNEGRAGRRGVKDSLRNKNGFPRREAP